MAASPPQNGQGLRSIIFVTVLFLWHLPITRNCEFKDTVAAFIHEPATTTVDALFAVSPQPLKCSVDIALHGFISLHTNFLGGLGISWVVGRHRCRQYGWMFTYSLRGGWNCTTVSSSSKNMCLISHISAQVGGVARLRFQGDTLTCSHPPPLLAMQKNDLPLMNTLNAPLPESPRRW